MIRMRNQSLQSLLPTLLPLLRAWQSASESERTAITSSEWNALKELQAEKTRLQVQIDGVLEQAGGHEGWTAPGLSLLPPELREQVTLLKRLEQENQALLEQKLTVVRSGMAQVNASVRHLRLVHQAYTQPSAGRWQSYS
jgi:hypothetical protein